MIDLILITKSHILFCPQEQTSELFFLKKINLKKEQFRL
jgi:hypothetical protein